MAILETSQFRLFQYLTENIHANVPNLVSHVSQGSSINKDLTNIHLVSVMQGERCDMQSLSYLGKKY